jgi:hypothetical protein
MGLQSWLLFVLLYAQEVAKSATLIEQQVVGKWKGEGWGMQVESH